MFEAADKDGSGEIDYDEFKIVILNAIASSQVTLPFHLPN